MRFAFLTLAAISLAGSAAAQMPLPPFGNFFTTGTTRGFYFQCPVNCIVTGLAVPDITDPFQVVEFIDFGLTAPPAFAASVVGTQMFYDNTTAAQSIIPVTLQLTPGNWYGVLGCGNATVGSATSQNPYSTQTGTFTSDILGTPTDIYRLLTQTPIGSNGGNQACSAELAGTISRVEVYITPAAGIFASFTSTPSTGASPLSVAFTDTTFTDDPGGVIAWDWDFDGDGISDSTAQNPTFVYTACGSYDVTLTATDVINGSNTTTVVGAVEVDDVVASFTVAELAPGTGLWLFTDTSAPTPISWDWDFDGDGIIDDTTQNPVYFDPGMSGLLSLPNCTLTVGGQGGCFTNTITQNVQATGYGVVEVLTGGNGTVGTPSVGTYFNVTVGAEGVNITDLNTGVYGFAGGMDVSVFVTAGGHAGKEGNINAWTLATSGSGIATGTGTVAVPEMVPVTLNNPFYLPANSTYGVAVMHTDQAGGSMQVSYTTGPGNAPYGNADLTIHPLDPTTGAPTGCSATTFMGPCVFQPRLWNGRLIYSTCSVSQAAAGGSYAAGCVNSAGVVPSLTVTGPPQIGANLSLEVDSGLAAPAAVLIAFGTSKDVYNGLPLPLDLGALGAPGCELATSIIVTDLLIANPGANPYSLALPNNPAYMCQVFYQQAAVLDVGVNALGFVLSNATATSLGN